MLTSTRGRLLQLKSVYHFQDARCMNRYRSVNCVRYNDFSASGTVHKQQRRNATTKTQRASTDITPRRCFVSGGASGIGYEVTKQLISNGASHVTITSRKSQKARDAIGKIQEETSCPDGFLSFVEHDFADPLPANFLAKSTSANGSQSQYDTLINCAGASQAQGLLATSSESTSLLLKTNLEAPIELSRQLLKQYFSNGKQLSRKAVQRTDQNPPSICVINVSSLLAQRGGYGTSIYSTSKAGLIAFTRTLALEAAAIRQKFPALPPFRANVVVPGYIDTPMISNFSDQHRQKLEGEIPLRRYGTAEEVADAIMFLLKNEYANNTVLNLDGGLSAT